MRAKKCCCCRCHCKVKEEATKCDDDKNRFGASGVKIELCMIYKIYRAHASTDMNIECTFSSTNGNSLDRQRKKFDESKKGITI